MRFVLEIEGSTSRLAPPSSQDRRAAVVPILDDLEDVATLFLGERG
jgi:hypothetical protein